MARLFRPSHLGWLKDGGCGGRRVPERWPSACLEMKKGLRSGKWTWMRRSTENLPSYSVLLLSLRDGGRRERRKQRAQANFDLRERAAVFASRVRKMTAAQQTPADTLSSGHLLSPTIIAIQTARHWLQLK